MKLNPTIHDDEEGAVPRWWVHRIDEDKQHPWRHRRLYWNDRFGHSMATRDRVVEGSLEWSLLRRPGFGVGFTLKTNGDESDVALSMYAGPVGSVWMRLRSPWTRRFKVKRKGEDDRDWYKARLYGFRLFPHQGRYLTVECGAREHEWSSKQPWWWQIGLSDRHVWGRSTVDTVESGIGECMIPMPEGQYPATWKTEVRTRRYIRWPGKVRNYWQKPTASVSLDIPGGIPRWGKGENSYDCGMDGLYGCGGATLEEAIGRAVSSSLRDRKRYGGPRDLPHPMTVSEAEAWALQERAGS